MQNGRVTLVATDATVRQILAEWARVGQTKIVNVERIPGGPLTLELTDVPEAQALDILLRSVSGYIAAPRPIAVAERCRASIASSCCRRAAARASAASPAPPPPVFQQPPQFMQQPPPADDDDDDEQPAPNVAVRAARTGVQHVPAAAVRERRRSPQTPVSPVNGQPPCRRRRVSAAPSPAPTAPSAVSRCPGWSRRRRSRSPASRQPGQPPPQPPPRRPADSAVRWLSSTTSAPPSPTRCASRIRSGSARCACSRRRSMNREVERGRALDDAEARQVVGSLVKQRKDSIEQFTKGGRQDLADKEAAEIARPRSRICRRPPIRRPSNAPSPRRSPKPARRRRRTWAA